MELMSDYFRTLERYLDCPKAVRRSFLEQTRQMAEDFLQGKPDAAPQELTDYLGEPRELAQGFLETLEQDILERYRKRKKIFLYGCIAVLAVLLTVVSVWAVILLNQPNLMEVSETVIIYAEPK